MSVEYDFEIAVEELTATIEKLKGLYGKALGDIKELTDKNEKLQKDLIQQRKISFWRMAESYSGYNENTCIHDDDWCNEVKEAMEEYHHQEEDLGSIDELLQEYKDWIGYYPSDEEEEEEEEEEEKFDPIAFEKADMENNTNYFEEQRKKGFHNDMFFHRKASSCFEWKNFDEWIKKYEVDKVVSFRPLPDGNVMKSVMTPSKGMEGAEVPKDVLNAIFNSIANGDIPSPLLKYPRKEYEGEYQDFYDSVEEEMKAIKEYFTKNKPRSSEAVKNFIENFEKGKNDMVDFLKGLDEEHFKYAFDGYLRLCEAYRKEEPDKDIKSVGRDLNHNGGINLMRMSFYLFAWDLECVPIAIKCAKSRTEHSWDGIGEWLA